MADYRPPTTPSAPERGVTDIHVTWGPEAASMTAEEKQKIVDGLRAEAEANHAERERAEQALAGTKYVPVPIDQLANIYGRFLRLVKMGQATIDEWTAMPKEVAELRHAIFAQADFGAVFAGQWLPKAERERVRAEVKAEGRTPRPAPCEGRHPMTPPSDTLPNAFSYLHPPQTAL